MIDENMAQRGRSWLPENAIAEGRVPQLIGAMVKEWSGKWFARGGLRLLGDRLERGPAGTIPEAEWLVLGDTCALSIAPPARALVAGLMLDGPVGDLELKPADRGVVDRLAAVAIDDLCRRIALLFGISGEWRSQAVPPPALCGHSRCCGFGTEAGNPALRLLVDEDLAVALRKRSVPARPRAVRLGTVETGLERQEVSVAALLGRCALPLPELAELAAGDVLLLDRDPTGALDLIVDGRPARGHCALDREAEAYRLRIPSGGLAA